MSAAEMETVAPPSERVDELVFRAGLVAQQYEDGLELADRLDFYHWLGVWAVQTHNEILDDARMNGAIR